MQSGISFASEEAKNQRLIFNLFYSITKLLETVLGEEATLGRANQLEYFRDMPSADQCGLSDVSV